MQKTNNALCRILDGANPRTFLYKQTQDTGSRIKHEILALASNTRHWQLHPLYSLFCSSSHNGVDMRIKPRQGSFSVWTDRKLNGTWLPRFYEAQGSLVSVLSHKHDISVIQFSLCTSISSDNATNKVHTLWITDILTVEFLHVSASLAILSKTTLHTLWKTKGCTFY